MGYRSRPFPKISDRNIDEKQPIDPRKLNLAAAAMAMDKCNTGTIPKQPTEAIDKSTRAIYDVKHEFGLQELAANAPPFKYILKIGE